MGGVQVVVVEAVLDQQLPVGTDVVFLRAGDDFEPSRRRLVDDQVEILLRAGEIVRERFRVVAEMGEPEAAILLQRRDFGQREIGLVERPAVGLLAGDVGERAVVAVGPAVIEAGEPASGCLRAPGRPWCRDAGMY